MLKKNEIKEPVLTLSIVLVVVEMDRRISRCRETAKLITRSKQMKPQKLK